MITKPALAAIQTIAQQVSGVLEVGNNHADAYLTVSGKRVPVHLAAGNYPNLRFDKVARWFVQAMRKKLHDSLPEDSTLLLTITAPIWKASKTSTDLQAAISHDLLSRTGPFELDYTINENRIRVSLVRGGVNDTRLIGFVHNPDCDPRALLDLAQSVVAALAS